MNKKQQEEQSGEGLWLLLLRPSGPDGHVRRHDWIQGVSYVERSWMYSLEVKCVLIISSLPPFQSPYRSLHDLQSTPLRFCLSLIRFALSGTLPISHFLHALTCRPFPHTLTLFPFAFFLPTFFLKTCFDFKGSSFFFYFLFHNAGLCKRKNSMLVKQRYHCSNDNKYNITMRYILSQGRL